jgi:hypothetical protein
MKKTIIIVLKGVLLYATLLVFILFITGVDSIYDNGYFIHSIIICAILFYACCKLINAEELDTITLYKWINNLSNKE